MLGLLTVVMAGGSGNRLQPLTARRAKPAVPFAGRRLIDYTLHNCERSGIRRVVVLLQYQSETVESHVTATWGDRLECEMFRATDAGRPFRGTADAVRLALQRFRGGRHVLVLAGDHVYGMDYRTLRRRHEEARAEATIAVVPVPRHDARAFGVPDVDGGFVRGFLEKPSDPPTLPGSSDLSLASMGIYLFDRAALAGYLADHKDEVDFGHEIVPGMVRAGYRCAVHDFADGRPGRYWRDIGDVDAYHGALMDLVCDSDDPPRLPGPPREAAPVQLRDGPGQHAPGVVRNSWLGEGCRVFGGSVERSVLGSHTRVDHHAEVVESVVLDGARVGAHARLRRVIVEEGAQIPPGMVLGWDRPGAGSIVTPGGIIVVPAGDVSPEVLARVGPC